MEKRQRANLMPNRPDRRGTMKVSNTNTNNDVMGFMAEQEEEFDTTSIDVSLKKAKTTTQNSQRIKPVGSVGLA